MLQETYKLSHLPRSYSRSMLNFLQDFMDKFGPPEDFDSPLETVHSAQLSKDSTPVVQAAEPNSLAISSQSTVSQSIDPSNLRDADSAEAMQLARAMTAKIQHHMVAYVRSMSSQFGLLLAEDGSSRLRYR